ncbi:anti-sigma factor family protein [Actinomadura alba]|uniref:Zf-HC2 domain-containing protein n=1 Tax=Actinomadura alba TaxID=406431 RepID=A0ABR7M1B9_9ACTN|nr:zf-HC2 domain-containing protein [Actinomadura alba]MBC6470688.1 zf-HC2 domain-containing protein [Actinomadura alba]
MSHLGERLTALVDGELGHDERDRALAHLAACEQCRAEAEALRRLKSQLRALRGADPAPGLLHRLDAMGDPTRPGPFGDPSGTTSARTGSSVARTGSSSPAVRRRRTRRPGRRAPAGGALRAPAVAARRDAPRGRYLIAGAATLAVLGVGASFAAGAQPERLPPVTPALEQFAVDHALTAGDVSIADPTVLRDPPVGP